MDELCRELVSTVVIQRVMEMGRSDDLCFERFTGSRLKQKQVTTQRTSRLRYLRALRRFLLLALSRAKEATKEARFFFLQVHLQILVVIQLYGGHLSMFRLRRCRLGGVQALRDEDHGL